MKFFLLILAFAGLVQFAGGETTVDVSQEWKAHVSSTAAVSLSTGTPLTVAPGQASGCECEDLSTQEKLEQCTYAFTGMVFEAGSPSKQKRRAILLDVDEIFKGSPKPEMKVVTDVMGTDCDIPFDEGRNYLVYARWEWGQAVTSRCMGTKLLDRPANTALGPSQALKDKMYVHLRNACMGRPDTPCCLASLKAMRAAYYLPEPEDGCPSGTVPDRLRCAGSYTWCIPVTAKDHRQNEH
jgi:hypothetical protein